MRITSEEIAKLAHVSRSTVSRVINNYSNVPEATRQKVMAVIEEYGYTPNSFARALAGKEKRVIAFCISDNKLDVRRWRGMGSIYYMRLMAEMISVAQEYECEIIVFILSEESDFVNIENMFLNREICGCVCIGFEYQMGRINQFIDHGYNMVVIDPGDERSSGEHTHFIFSENEEGAWLGTNYLLQHQHRNIGYIAGDNRLSGQHRLQGYLRAMREAGIEQPERFVEVGNFVREDSYQAALRLLEKQEITAIFAANDLGAVAAMQAAMSKGRRVPEDIAILGGDYTPMYKDLGFYITSVEISVREIAEAAVKGILNDDLDQEIHFEAKIRRGSTV